MTLSASNKSINYSVIIYGHRGMSQTRISPSSQYMHTMLMVDVLTLNPFVFDVTHIYLAVSQALKLTFSSEIFVGC